ncbi:MAG: methylenetetrahydrofolate reductase C-terminal domain-containing protein [Acidimicrobiia bacterium]|nr:methylenetetrahydrofolate reductase C-terminal domain-containing protein [Acidimicrobiia bacterium]
MTQQEAFEAQTEALRFGDRKEKGIWRKFRFFLQDHPTPLVWGWKLAEAVLKRMGGLFERIGVKRSSRWMTPVEELIKKPIFDCQMCGQCILHSTGMTCPMTCPKQLRNGPCGGVRMDGKCEVIPEADCIWVKAVERSAKTSYSNEIGKLNPPVDWQLHKTSSWVTVAIGRDQVVTGSGSGPHHASEVISS